MDALKYLILPPVPGAEHLVFFIDMQGSDTVPRCMAAGSVWIAAAQKDSFPESRDPEVHWNWAQELHGRLLSRYKLGPNHLALEALALHRKVKGIPALKDLLPLLEQATKEGPNKNG